MANCYICNKDISSFTETRRLQHVNNCLNSDEQKNHFVKKCESYESTIDCPLCQTPLSSGPFRIAHLKKCSRENNIIVGDLLKLIKTQEQVALTRRTLNLPHTKLQKPTLKSCAPKQAKNKLLPRKVDNEHVQLALALSTSEASTSQASCKSGLLDYYVSIDYSKVKCGSRLQTVSRENQIIALQDRLLSLVSSVTKISAISSDIASQKSWWAMQNKSHDDVKHVMDDDSDEDVQIIESADADSFVTGCSSESNAATSPVTPRRNTYNRMPKAQENCSSPDLFNEFRSINPSEHILLSPDHVHENFEGDADEHQRPFSPNLARQSPDLLLQSESTTNCVEQFDFCLNQSSDSFKEEELKTDLLEKYQTSEEKNSNVLFQPHTDNFTKTKDSDPKLTLGIRTFALPKFDQIHYTNFDNEHSTIEPACCTFSKNAGSDSNNSTKPDNLPAQIDRPLFERIQSLLKPSSFKKYKSETFGGHQGNDVSVSKLCATRSRDDSDLNFSLKDGVTSELPCPDAKKDIMHRTFTILKRTNVTPMPQFERYSSPELGKELGKYGLKSMARRRAVPMLRRLFDETHPYVNEKDEFTVIDSGPVTKGAKRKNKATRLSSSQPVHSVNVTTGKNVKKGPAKFSEKQLKEIPHGKSSARPISLSQSYSPEAEAGESSGDEEAEGDGIVAEESFLPDPVADAESVNDDLNVEDRLRQFFTKDIQLYRQLLTYKPLPLKETHALVKKSGIKCSLNTFMNFLDSQCITFTMKDDQRNPGVAYRPRKRLKT